MKYSKLFPVRVALLVIVSGPLLSLLFIQGIPQEGNLWGESLNAGHAVLFGVIAAMLLWTLKARPQFTRGTVLRQYFTVGIAMQLLGITTELIQPYFHRDCELGDMIRDGVGIFIFLSVLATINHRLDDHARQIGRKVRLALITTTIVCLVAVSIPADGWALAYLHRAEQFPVVAAYDSWMSRKFLVMFYARLTPVDPPVGWTTERPDKCALVTFFPARFPGFVVQEVERDWRGFDSLRVDVYSELETIVLLTLGVDDFKRSYIDRYNTVRKIGAGLNHISIPLAEIEQASKKRKLDLGSMDRIVLYSPSPRDSFSLYIGPISLIH